MATMTTKKRVLGKEHPNTLISMHNLAFAWKAQGETAKAINLMDECVNLQTRIKGANPHPQHSRNGKYNIQR